MKKLEIKEIKKLNFVEKTNRINALLRDANLDLSLYNGDKLKLKSNNYRKIMFELAKEISTRKISIRIEEINFKYDSSNITLNKEDELIFALQEYIYV